MLPCECITFALELLKIEPRWEPDAVLGNVLVQLELKDTEVVALWGLACLLW